MYVYQRLSAGGFCWLIHSCCLQVVGVHQEDPSETGQHPGVLRAVKRARFRQKRDRCAWSVAMAGGVSEDFFLGGKPTGNIWVCLKMLCTPKPNGFADHYPY